MFRREDTSLVDFTLKFDELKTKFDKLESIRLDSEYLREMQSYIERLYVATQDIDQKRFAEIKSLEMSNLNRLQKLKKRTTYRKDKHRNRSRDQDWG